MDNKIIIRRITQKRTAISTACMNGMAVSSNHKMNGWICSVSFLKYDDNIAKWN